MSVKIEDRPIKGIREEVIDQLGMNYAHKEITLEAFEKRLDLAMDTEDRSVLLDQVADLDLTTDNQYEKTKAAKLSKDKDYFDNNSAYLTNVACPVLIYFTVRFYNLPLLDLKF